jgi:hypothetical protein
VSNRIGRNDAIEIVGRAKFGASWVGPATDEEFKLAKKYRSRFATGARVPEHEADMVYEAEEREARADRQHREVIHWLENRGLDCVRGIKDGLDRDAFDKAFRAEFGQDRQKLTVQQRKRVRYVTDDDLVRAGIAGIRAGTFANPLKAAQKLALRAEGASATAAVDRLRKKIAAEW